MSLGLYLGEQVEPGQATRAQAELDPSDLLTHGRVVGMTGSGKTALAIASLYHHYLLKEYVIKLKEYVIKLADVVEAERGTLTRVDPSRFVAHVAPARRGVKVLQHDRVWVY